MQAEATLPRSAAVPALAAKELGVREIPHEHWAGAAADWDRWVPHGHLCLSHRFLSCAQHVEMDGFALTPLRLIEADGRGAGIAAAYRSAVDVAELGDRRVQAVVHALRRVFPRLLKYQVVELGLPVGVGLPAHAAAAPQWSVRALARWAMDIARQRRDTLVVLRDLDATAAPASIAELQRLGFRAVPMPANHLLALPFASFAAYKAQMRSAYRRRLEQCLKHTAALRCEVVADFSELAGELAALWRGLYERVGRYHRVVVTERFFREASRLPESRALLLRRADGSLAGFGLVYLDGPVLRYSSTGFTREAARDEGVYQRLLYEVIRLAIESGCEAASLGQSTAEPKLRVGAHAVPLQAWIWHHSALRRQLVSRLAGAMMKATQTPPLRHVFHEPLPSYRDPALHEAGTDCWSAYS